MTRRIVQMLGSAAVLTLALVGPGATTTSRWAGHPDVWDATRNGGVTLDFEHAIAAGLTDHSGETGPAVQW